jgi:membrane-bound metal-dependent hydrolase YbcI (DUF457 family)
MPQAVMHILIPIIMVDTIRDHVFKQKRRLLPNKYVLLAGLAGLLPDIDLPLSMLLGQPLHRTITHSLLPPLVFLCGVAIFYFFKKIKSYKILLMLFVGFSLHIFLDFLLTDSLPLLFPFSFETYGLNILGLYSSTEYNVFTIMDAILLFFWLIHEELEHKISDYL